MLETVRENLKGTLVVVVMILFIIPMVISGVGSSFLGSVAGTEAAIVNGQSVTNSELDRAIRLRRNQLLERQGVDASSPFLTDESLRLPVLDSLTRRAAISSEGERSGMAMSDNEFANVIRSQEGFFSDGQFNQQKYNSLLAQIGMTSSSYKRQLAKDLVVAQQAAGLQLSSFATEAQFEQLVKLTHQKRSFFSVVIPESKATELVSISEADISSYYDTHQQEFEVPQKAKVQFIELSVEGLKETVEVTESEVVQQYDAETANFTTESSVTVAHILLEGDSKTKADELHKKIQDGEAFFELAKEYSDDIASSDMGGELGVLTPGMFPEAFEQAAMSLEQGEVSDAVETDAGIHFIKVTEKNKTEVPTLESRREGISREIATAKAQDNFSAMVDTLGELTYFSDSLAEASEQLGLPLQESSYFDLRSGSGVAEHASVRDAAFDEKVLVHGHNSNTVQIDGTKVVVLRLLEQKPAYTKALEEVLPLVEAKVQEAQVSAKLEELATDYESNVLAGGDAGALAQEKSYEFLQHDLATRTDFSIDQEAISLAFSASLPTASPSFASRKGLDGSYRIVAVTAVEEGEVSDLSDSEKQGFLAQIEQEFSNFIGSAYEALVVESAEIEIY